ncbi:MAG TPA: alanine racemase, partial [Victivallales bacterium]|nr:alanine racemase [Victivallales bacterium]
KIAESLSDAGTHSFGVAELNEALQLIPLKKNIQILGAILPEEIEEALKNKIIIPICEEKTATLISNIARKKGIIARCHILIDTGMGRLGIRFEKAKKIIPEIMNLKNISFDGIYSHFPNAYQQNCPYTKKQIEDFKELLNYLNKKGINFKTIHIANSDAINNYPETFKNPFNTVRTGINLHGNFDPEGQRSMKLKSILTLKTRLASIRKLPAGAFIGYGCTYKLPEDTIVGTISAGYADGLPLALSNRGYVLINGKQCPILGRVSMDYTTISLMQVPESKIGDEVICLGGKGLNEITVDQWAKLKGTHSYEIICSFGSRVKRIYID